MSNSLEKYIQDHRNELDVLEPSQNVWEGIRSEMQINPTFVKSTVSWLKYFGFGASVIAALVYLRISSGADPAPKDLMEKEPVLAQQTMAVTEPEIVFSAPDVYAQALPEVKVPAPPVEKPVVLEEVTPVAGEDSTENISPLTDTESTNHSSNPTTMKSTALKTALLFSALAFDTMAVVNAQDTDKDKNAITQERTVSSFSELDIRGVGDIFISQGDKEKVTVTASEKMQPLIEVLNEGNKLIIRQKKEDKGSSCKGDGGIDIHVTIKDISKLKVSGIGKIKTSTPLNLKTLDCEISAMGNLNLELNCKKFTADISSIGNMTLKGHAEEADVELSGMGNLHALEFEVGKLKAEMSGMGNAEVNAKESLEVEASGMGNLKYKGNPQKEAIKASGMGNVKKI